MSDTAADLVLLFALNMKALKSTWPRARSAVKQDGALWVAYPKKSSGIESDLSMGEWDVTKGSGWNAVSMIAIDEAWAAVRFTHAPGLDEARHTRQDEHILDADGTVCVDRTNRVVTAPRDLQKLFAKKPETRSARLANTVAMLLRGSKNPSDKR